MAKMQLLLLLLGILLFSCKDQEKEKMEQSMHELPNTISLYKHDLEERGAFIENNSNLSKGKKQQYHYDNLVNVQQKQEARVAQLQTELDSLENIYGQRYKTKQ